MGACSFTTRASGNTMSEAYRNAVDDAETEYGHDSYNGTISTTSGFVDVTQDFKRSGDTLSAFVDKTIDGASKWGRCFGICTEEPVVNNNKVKSKVDHVITKGTRKWTLEYVVYTCGENKIKSFPTKTEAIKFARNYSEKNKTDVFINMEKRVSGNATVAKVSYKSSNKEKPGRYLFYGWAAE